MHQRGQIRLRMKPFLVYVSESESISMLGKSSSSSSAADVGGTAMTGFCVCCRWTAGRGWTLGGDGCGAVHVTISMS